MSITGALGVALGPLLHLPLFLVVLIMSLLVSLISTLIYKYTTDQDLMKTLKEELKSLQKLIKEFRHDPQKSMEVNEKLMKVNSRYFMQSLKPMIYTLLPLLLIFGWMQANLAYDPLLPASSVSIDVSVAHPGYVDVTIPSSFTLTSSESKLANTTTTFTMIPTKAGTYPLTFTKDGESVQKDILVTNERKYLPTVQKFSSSITQVSVHHQKAIALNLQFIKIGWLGTYILLSILFSTLLRKMLRVY